MSDSVESDHLQSMHLADNPQPMHLGEEFLVAPGHILNPCQCRVERDRAREHPRVRQDLRGVFGVRVISRSWQRTTRRSAFQRFPPYYSYCSEGTQYARRAEQNLITEFIESYGQLNLSGDDA